jgi:hypothetical protein
MYQHIMNMTYVIIYQESAIPRSLIIWNIRPAIKQLFKKVTKVTAFSPLPIVTFSSCHGKSAIPRSLVLTRLTACFSFWHCPKGNKRLALRSPSTRQRFAG